MEEKKDEEKKEETKNEEGGHEMKLKEEAETYKKERDEYLEDLKRAKADLLNYKKEEGKRMEDFAIKEKEKMVLGMLEVLDNFKRAAKEAEKRKNDDLINGFLKIKEQFEDLLHKEGVKEIKAEGEEFDPYYHEAIETVEDENEESGMIVEEKQKGYLMNERIVRPSKVKVVK